MADVGADVGPAGVRSLLGMLCLLCLLCLLCVLSLLCLHLHSGGRAGGGVCGVHPQGTALLTAQQRPP